MILDSDIEKCIEFHGHSCPGLAIGIRASEFCLKTFGHNNDADLVAICETDMCGVDAIQWFTGCTLGKGNLIQKDYGKVAFTFYSRKSGEGKRLVFNKRAMDDSSESKLKSLKKKKIMEAGLSELFNIMEPIAPMPRGADILNTHYCSKCGEPVMESRIRLYLGEQLCIPCFNKIEQKK